MEMQRWMTVMFVALLACSTYGSAETEKPGVLEGKVTVGPLRPGPSRVDDAEPAVPPELFAKHRIQILTTGNQKVKEVVIDAKGFFKTELPPGNYLVTLTPNDIGMRKQPPSRATIISGKTATLNLDFDTGMR